jgi:hypothetical protein
MLRYGKKDWHDRDCHTDIHGGSVRARQDVPPRPQLRPHLMRFARKYIRRASVQGHAEVISRIKEMRSCVMCGMDDTPLARSRCHQARYCGSACSEKHWCESGGVGDGVS